MNTTKRSPRVVLGIDPGTGRLGWSILTKIPRVAGVCRGGLELVDCGCIETKSNTPLAIRLQIIFETLEEVILKYKPTELAVEELFFVKNIKTGISVAHARGVVLLVAQRAGLEIFEYKPNEIKSSVAGYGHATKDQMTKMIAVHLKGCKITQDDIVDAIAVALCHIA